MGEPAVTRFLQVIILVALIVWIILMVRKRGSRKLQPSNDVSIGPVNTYKGPLSFFRKHYNGDYSLARSYWINTGLLSIFAPTLGVILIPWLSVNFPARYSSAAILLITFFGISAWIWAVSGTWASANKHTRRGGKRFWVIVVKLMIVLGILRTFSELGDMAPVFGEHLAVAFGKQPGPESEIEVLADGKTIRLSGGINDETSERLGRALNLAPSVNTLVLSSDGGWIRQGEMLARLIERRNLNTYVETNCSSACTIAFLAGKERAADPSAKIGFHSVRAVGGNESGVNAKEREATKLAYAKANLSLTFLDRVARTPSTEMWFPTHDELRASGVLTRKSMGG